MEFVLRMQERTRIVAISFILFIVLSATVLFVPYVVKKQLDEHAEQRMDETFEKRVAETVEFLLEAEVEAIRASEAVVTNWRAEAWVTGSDGTVEFDVYGAKQRGECVFVTDTSGSLGNRAGLGIVSGRPTKVDVEFLNDTDGASRPRGAQFFRRWRAIPPAGEEFDAGPIHLPTVHYCITGKDENGKETGTFEFQSAGPFMYPGIPGVAPVGAPIIRLPIPEEGTTAKGQ